MAKKKRPTKSKKERLGSEDSSRGSAGQEAGSGSKVEPRSESANDDPGGRSGCVVVGVGASAGGLEAYKCLLRHLPSNSGVAFVLVQHLDPTHESLMVELLSKYTKMSVQHVEDETPIEPNHVYMIPPNQFISMRNGVLHLEPPVAERGVRLPINHFFRSLAMECRERAICVVLSGTGTDGAEGVRHVKAEGGMTIVEHPDSAAYDGMPRAAVLTGAVDYLLPCEEMANVIVSYAKHPYVNDQPRASLAERAPDHFRAILTLLQAHTDHDFTRYKKGTLTRRIERRMGIRHLDNPADYLKLLRNDAAELKELFKDMLIGVTRFFRDDDCWEMIADLIGRRIRERTSEEPFRVWVPGCSTGEEAYTIAMLLHEQQEILGRRLDTQIFGTDIDSESIEIARLGVYSDGIASDLPDGYVDRFFHREGDRLRVKKGLRESCVFAAQNLLSDPPFSGLDLISCRNLLIYIESDVQRRVFDMFHFALKPSGLLFLGSSESPGNRSNQFKTIAQKARIYEKVGESRSLASALSMGATEPTSRPVSASDGSFGVHPTVSITEISKKALMDAFAPASVVVNQKGMIQYIHGPVRDYLDFPTGEPELDLAAMALDGLKAKTRQALQRARTDDQVTQSIAPHVRRNGSRVAVRIRVQPLSAMRGESKLYLISFTDEGTSKASDSESVWSEELGQLEGESERELALELQATREDLQSTIEEVESANEELKASNEEVMSMNEELQSTNEELETSREELQSLNEELSTVNNQLHDKVDEVEHTNDDLTNLLASTEMATLFLDSDLRIRKFTPATKRLMNLIDSDIGRPIVDLVSRVNDPDMEQDAREVLTHLAPVEKEVQSRGGQWFMRRINPFRTSENKIEGVVMTFSDVTSVKVASRQIENRERQQAIIAQLGRAALSGLDLAELLDRAVVDLAETLETEFAKVLQLEEDRRKLKLVAGYGWREGLVGSALVPTGIDSQAGYTLQSSAPTITKDLRKEKRFSGPELLSEHEVTSGMSVIIGPEDAPWGVLGVHSKQSKQFSVDDANFVQSVANLIWEAIQRKNHETKLRDNEVRMQAFLSNSAVVAWMKDEQLRYTYMCPTFENRFDLDQSEWIGKTDFDVWPDEIAKQFRLNDEHVLKTGDTIETVEQSAYPNGERPHFFVSKFLLTNSSGERFVGGLGIDISDRIAVESELAENQQLLQAFIDNADICMGVVELPSDDSDVLHVLDNVATERFFGVGRHQTEGRWARKDLQVSEECVEQWIAKYRESESKRRATRFDYYHPEDESVGEGRWLNVSVSYMGDGEEGRTRFCYTASDDTERRKAEISVRESEERLQLAAQMAGFGTYYGDFQTGQLIWSSELKSIFGLASDESIEHAAGEVTDQIHPEDRERVEERFRESLDPRGQGVLNLEHRIVRRDGEVRWVMLQGKTAFQGDGPDRKPSRIAGVVLDITLRHAYEEQVVSARQMAEQANRAKSQFLANMSHEIRTPMTAILGYADVLMDRTNDRDVIQCVRTIRRNADYLLELINDILDLSKIEAGKMTPEIAPCNVAAILSNVRSLLNVRAEVKELYLDVELEGEVPELIQTDDKLFRQVLINLVGNAIKFTQEGGVVVKVSCNPDQQSLNVSVTDTGIGISQHDLKRLFRPFEQVDNSNTRGAGGSGLGLSISKRIIDLLGGKLEIESELGKGSTFRFTIATGSLDSVTWVPKESDALAEAESQNPSDTLPAVKGRVLTVDDRRDIRFLAKAFLQSAGATIIERENGEQAIETWVEAREKGEAIDAILMDLQMPVMDGLTATRRLREEGYTGPIIALTASAMDADRQGSLAAGCTDFVSKPINKADLITKLAAWIAHSEQDSQPE
ncbi:PAS domain S-box protein [Roseiconus nitratireducens]|uniref:PAS domain S-box protein n=1 Tax=Roseiconus nitratireducens TaxID=2605748 RepID=A0A5M6D1I1_9BACT|nr:chemotaxis protein CheB [Roseiconus nitratireducens]KAA5541324.1 PAS domain S-box protein [Roseiconus nitratireducens]